LRLRERKTLWLLPVLFFESQTKGKILASHWDFRRKFGLIQAAQI
jgi:hypothetical protein